VQTTCRANLGISLLSQVSSITSQESTTQFFNCRKLYNKVKRNKTVQFYLECLIQYSNHKNITMLESTITACNSYSHLKTSETRIAWHIDGFKSFISLHKDMWSYLDEVSCQFQGGICVRYPHSNFFRNAGSETS